MVGIGAHRELTVLAKTNIALLVRRIHTYVGVLIAPSVLFLAATGSLQLYGLHESHDGYHAPAFIRSLSAIHKEQTYVPPPERAPHAAGAPGDHGPPLPDEVPPPSTTLLKAYYLSVAFGLIGSTVAGVWMALTFSRNKRLIWALLLLGVVLPVAILAI